MVAGPGDVVSWMKNQATGEMGLDIVDSNGYSHMWIPADYLSRGIVTYGPDGVYWSSQW